MSSEFPVLTEIPLQHILHNKIDLVIDCRLVD